QGWTHGQAVGLELRPRVPDLNWSLNGTILQSHTQVANALGLSPWKISCRIKNGWTPEQIMGLAPDPKRDVSKNAGKANKITLDGGSFDSLKKACQYYQVKYGVAKQRLSNGWSLKEALELVDRETPRAKITVEGVKYPSMTAAARAYKLDHGAVALRLRMGYTPEQALGLVPMNVLQKDDRALLWAFENEYDCNAYEMLSDFHRRKLSAVCPEKRLLKLFSRWGVWPYVDDRLVMPLVVELSMLTALNVEAIKLLEIDSYQPEHRLTGQPVIYYRKPRSGSSARSEDRELHLQTLELDELYLDEQVTERVHRLFQLILEITAKIRSQASPEISRRLIVFEDVERSRREGCRVIVPLEPKGKAGHWYRRFCSDEGLYRIFGPNFNFNVSRCRATLATNMVLAGAGLFQVQMALGHENIQTTALYLDEKRLRPAFNKTVSQALECISRRSKEFQRSNPNVVVSSERCKERDTSGFLETLSGCGCIDPYQPSDAIKKVTGFKEGSICKYWNMCLLCDCSVITEHSLPKLIVYRNRVAAALGLNSPSINARKELYTDVLELIDDVLKPDVIFPAVVVENAKYIAVSMDD
ncbi:MAG: site-specific integrase, partial [Chlorobium sp.]|nr:site-specific integrase [Chlorobium sp.]